MKDKIIELLKEGKSYNYIVENIGCSKATINYHAKNLGLAKTAVQYDWKAVQEYHDEGHSRLECSIKFGFSKGAWDKAISQKRLIPNRLWITPIEDYLVSDRPRTGRTTLKRRLIKEGLLVDKCSECGIIEWRGKKLSLDIHHINGIKTDNRLENLCLLCPNCHRQTDTFAGKNNKKK
jgi:hypothetical protein